jgi:hypothetical protein
MESISTLNLQLICLLKIKNFKELFNAFCALNTTNDVINEIISQKIKHKMIVVHRSDRIGLDIELMCIFKNNYSVSLRLHKKRHKCLCFGINDGSSKCVFSRLIEGDCYDILIKYFVHQFDEYIINYIKTYSNKWINVKELIIHCIKLSNKNKFFNFNCYIDEEKYLSMLS